MGYNYIMFELIPPKGPPGSDLGIKRLLPFIYPDSLVHADVAQAVAAMALPGLLKAKVVSAGSCQLTCLDVSGKSDTLEVSSNPEDCRRINMFPYFHGIEDENDS